MSTLRAYFEGRRELFSGLEIERLEGEGPDAWAPHAVFHFDFTGRNYLEEGALEAALDSHLARWEAEWGIESGGPGGRLLGDRFWNLLAAAHARTGRRCAVLVDEYDKPLLEAMDDPALQDRNRAVFKSFFGVLKGADEHIRFAFLTGVTKFSKVSVFSDLNQLRDISMVKEYAGICGVTSDELVGVFSDEVDGLAEEMGLARGKCLERLEAMYDGYCFCAGCPHVYNPFSLLNAFADRKLGSYWFESGTPTFLVRKLREIAFDVRKLTDGTLWASGGAISDYRAENPDPLPLLCALSPGEIAAVCLNIFPRGSCNARTFPRGTLLAKTNSPGEVAAANSKTDSPGEVAAPRRRPSHVKWHLPCCCPTQNRAHFPQGKPSPRRQIPPGKLPRLTRSLSPGEVAAANPITFPGEVAFGIALLRIFSLSEHIPRGRLA